VVTFNPTAPGNPTTNYLSPTHNPIFGGLEAVACPSASQCTAVGNGALTFNPNAPGNPTPALPEGDGQLVVVACPSLWQCTTVDVFGRATTFDPNAPGSAIRALIESGGVGPGPPVIVAPRITHIGQSHGRWREGRALAKLSRGDPSHSHTTNRAPVGTTFSFSLSEGATVSLRFTRALSGRKVGHTCVAPERRSPRRAGCKRTITAGKLTFSGHPGANIVVFQGRISRSVKLDPARYTLIVEATISHLRSAPAKLVFTIVK
jgi:hypothetical protein